MGDACSRCKGHGTVWIGYPPRVPCPDCRGTGRREIERLLAAERDPVSGDPASGPAVP